jgi:hypothetical protein
VCISVSVYACCARQYFWRKSVLESRLKIDVVIMIICSIVIIINSVLTLQVLTAKYPMIADLAK